VPHQHEASGFPMPPPRLTPTALGRNPVPGGHPW
jgi:hypothetical protein